MDFYIKQNATLPSLKMQVTYDVDVDYEKVNSMLDNSVITFSMVNVDNKTLKIANKEARLVIEEDRSEHSFTPKIYYLQYDFTLKDTNKTGSYQGEFCIDVLNDSCGGKLKLPLKENLFIHVQNSITKTDVL